MDALARRRAFRLTWPLGTEIYEIDMPRLVSFKDEVLGATVARPRCTRTAIAVDLRDDWAPALLDHGFQPDRPSLWLIEGLLIVLGFKRAVNAPDRSAGRCRQPTGARTCVLSGGAQQGL